MKNSSSRREFIKSSAMAAGLLATMGFSIPSTKTHLLTLSFDDGFKKSFYKIAELHEEYGFKACLNIIATGHLETFSTEQRWIPQNLLGDFEDWNLLRSRGHEIMPHTWEHLNATEIPLELAKENIDKCLNYFEENLDGYQSSKAIYNFAYNASTLELDNYVLEKARAVRTGGWLVFDGTKVSSIPISEIPVRLGCWGHGPDFCDDYVEQEVSQFLTSEGGWLILNLHGLDDEGWGPISTIYLDSLLKRLTNIDYLDFRPAGDILNLYKKT